MGEAPRCLEMQTHRHTTEARKVKEFQKEENIISLTRKGAECANKVSSFSLRVFAPWRLCEKMFDFSQHLTSLLGVSCNVDRSRVKCCNVTTSKFCSKCYALVTY